MKRIICVISVFLLLAMLFCGTVTVSAADTGVLNGKKAIFFGDSIGAGWRDAIAGEGVNDWANSGGWSYRLQRDFGMQSTLKAIAGNSFTQIPNRSRIIEQIKASPWGGYDYVVFQGGFNDAMGENSKGSAYDNRYVAPVGTLSTGFELGSFDTATFAGAMEEFLCYVNMKYPDAKVGFIITYQTPHSEYGGVTKDSAKMRQYYSMAKQICAKWGIGYLDLYDGTAPDGKHYSNDVLDMDNASTASVPGGADHIHLSKEGYDRITPYIADWMAGLEKMHPATTTAPATTTTAAPAVTTTAAKPAVTTSKANVSGVVTAPTGAVTTDTATVGTTVVEDAAPTKPADADAVEENTAATEKEVGSENGGNTGLTVALIILVVLAVLVVAAIVVILLLRKKGKIG